MQKTWRLLLCVTLVLIGPNDALGTEPCEEHHECGQDATNGYGCVLGTFRGVDAKSNGGWTGGACGDYQCVAYVKDFYRSEVEDEITESWGIAADAYDLGDDGLDNYPNDGTTVPAPGDVVCFDDGDYGHVAICTEVGTNYIKVIDQNRTASSSNIVLQLAMDVNNGHYHVHGFGQNEGYAVEGWMRDPDYTPPTYLCSYVSKSITPAGPYTPGQEVQCEIRFKNEGTATWLPTAGSQYVELASCNGAAVIGESFFNYPCSNPPPLSWNSCLAPCEFIQNDTQPGETATFQFSGGIRSDATPGPQDVYFGPCFNGAIIPGWGQAHFTVTVEDPPPPLGTVPYDFDGDGLSDAWDRTSTGLFHIDFCDDGLWGWEWTGQQYGGTQDTPCPADYDGDGVWDIAVLRNSDRKFLIDVASNNLGWFDITNLSGYGGYGDTPIPADYDGDGSADIGFRWADGSLKIDYSSNGYTGWDVNEGGYGGAYDTPCAADFNGDGHADVAILRNSDRMFLIDYWATNGFKGYDVTNLGGYGGYGDTPCPADYDDDGYADVAVRDADEDWHIDYHANGFGGWDWTGYGYGSTPDPPRSGDYDGDGLIDIAIYAAADSVVCFDRRSNGYGSWDACDDGHPSWKQPSDPTPEPDGPTITLRREDRKPVTVEIYDVSGRLITSQVRTEAPGSLSLARRIVHERSLPGGIYFVRLLGPSGRTTQKLVVLR